MRHKQVRVSHGGMKARVDEGMAHVILLLWALGIGTRHSCEGRPGHRSPGQRRAYIQFFEAAGAKSFVEAVALFDPELAKVGRVDDLYYRALLTNESNSKRARALSWEYHCSTVFDAAWNEPLEQYGSDVDLPDHSGVVNVVFPMAVYFPSSDIPVIVERLTATAKRLKHAALSKPREN